MRPFVIGLCLAACGGASLPATPAPVPVRRVATEPDRPPVDPIAALTPDDTAPRSWVVPGPIYLELGAAAATAGSAGRPIEVTPIDEEGKLQRVAVRLDHARFSVWIDGKQMLGVLRHDQRLDALGVPAVGGEVQAVLRAGATVSRIGHRDGSTQIRYVGALEIAGWVPNDALTDRGAARDVAGRIPTGRKTFMVLPGAVIRAEPRWAASELALMGTAYSLDIVRELDDGWTEVSYEDGDLIVHGFVSRRDPPGHLHHWSQSDPPLTVAPNATVASGTCLYGRAGGDAIGYVVGNSPVALDDLGTGWWSVTLDTPWGALGFAARGPSKTELLACAPPGTVPPATP